ncbi:hypothetical protein FA95DRAFT_1521734 [Auriscalpium vulgare]|uniref:Uncharacterized protein n=1 Tax=Auriscalpium vulgare TaxID=40419 RepID=A0ACB8RM40_9AGAM|nr:hypothetical protein FA95DRAFT_1521734 [Auriscalpium vulgare]
MSEKKSSVTNAPPPPPPLPENPKDARSYDQWEEDVIVEYLRRQPEPTGPDSYEKAKENLILAGRYKARIEVIVNNLPELVNRTDLKIADTLAEATWKRKVLLYRLFPINRMPVEILSNIFRFVVWSSVEANQTNLLRLRMTWVCRHWRQVAIADQTLWNTIWFRDSAPFDRSLTFFDRAGTATIDLRINESRRYYQTRDEQLKMTGPQMEVVADILMTKVDQIRTLIVVVESWPPILVLLERLYRARTPTLLARVEIHRTGHPYSYPGPAYTSVEYHDALRLCNGDAPSLNFLCLNGIHLNWDHSPMNNLTTLDLRRMPSYVAPSIARFREVLRNSPNLRKLAIDGAGPEHKPEDTTDLGPPIDLLRLTTIVFGDVTPAYAIWFNAGIRAPNVRDLTLINLIMGDYGPVLKFLTGRFPNVVVLTLFNIEVLQTAENLRSMTQWLLSMPIVQYLRIALLKPHLFAPFLIDGRFHAEDVPLNPTPEEVARVVSSGQRIAVFPELSTLEFQHIPSAAIIGFVGRRKELGIPLDLVYINRVWLPQIKEEERKELLAVVPTQVCLPAMSTPAEERLWTTYNYGPVIDSISRRAM